MKKQISDFDIYGVAAQQGGPMQALHVETIQARQQIHSWNVQPHRHSVRDQLFLWRSGEAVLHLAERNVPVMSMSLVYIPKGHVHGTTLTRDADVCVVSPTRDFLSGSVGPELAKDLLALRDPFILQLEAEKHSRLISLFREMEDEYAAKSTFYLAVCSGLLRIMLSLLLRALPIETSPHIVQNDEQLISRLRVLIEVGYRENRRLAEYARDLAVSERKLMRACQQSADCSVVQMVLARRLLEAKHLLRFTSLSIGEIAGQLGFHDLPHFSRVFKDRVGSSPQDWKKHVMANC